MDCTAVDLNLIETQRDLLLRGNGQDSVWNVLCPARVTSYPCLNQSSEDCAMHCIVKETSILNH